MTCKSVSGVEYVRRGVISVPTNIVLESLVWFVKGFGRVVRAPSSWASACVIFPK